MPDKISEKILGHLLEQTLTLGELTKGQEQIDKRLQEGDQDLKEIKTELKKKATRKDVHRLADVAVKDHEQAFHPTKEEKLGRQVLNIWDQLMDHKKITITAAGGVTVLILKLMGVG